MGKKNKKDSVSVMIAAYNEEENIADAVKSVYSGLKGLINDYEMIIINDGSTDDTGRIISGFAKKDRRIKILTHRQNLGFGSSIKDGIKLAEKTYLTGFPGDNDMSAVSFRSLLKRRKSADLIISYMANPQVRPLHRRLASLFFVKIMNKLFGLNLKYFNGYFIAKTNLVKKLPLRSCGLAVFAEIIVRLIKNGVNYQEVSFFHSVKKNHQSKAVSIKSIFQTMETIVALIRDLYFIQGSR